MSNEILLLLLLLEVFPAGLFNTYAPINVRPAGGGRRGKGAGFDIQTKFCVKFPTPGIQVLVKSIVPRGN